MLVEFARYPIRPVCQQGESLAGFICRYYGANGHCMLTLPYRALSIIYRSNDSSQLLAAWQTITKLIGPELIQDRVFWRERCFVAGAKNKNHWWLKSKSRTFRACPECLKLYGYHLEIWDLPLFNACPVHRCMLLDHCDCGRAFEWQSVMPNWTCQCGKSFAALVAPSSSALVEFSHALLASSSLPLPNNFDIKNTGVVKNQNLVACYELIDYLNNFCNIISNVGVSKGWHVVPGMRVARLLNQWPYGFETIVNRLLRFQSRCNREILVAAMPDSYTGRLLAHLDLAQTNFKLEPEVQRVILRLLNKHVAPATKRLQAIFNPTMSEEEKNLRMLRFKAWWCDFIDMAERMESDKSPKLELVPSYQNTLDGTGDWNVIIDAIRNWNVTIDEMRDQNVEAGRLRDRVVIVKRVRDCYLIINKLYNHGVNSVGTRELNEIINRMYDQNEVFDQRRDRDLIILLNTLINAAMQGWPVSRYRRLAEVWPTTKNISNLQPLALLKYINVQLYNLPYADLYHIAELSESIDANAVS